MPLWQDRGSIFPESCWAFKKNRAVSASFYCGGCFKTVFCAQAVAGVIRDGVSIAVSLPNMICNHAQIIIFCTAH